MTKQEKKEIAEIVAQAVTVALSKLEEQGKLGTKIVERRIVESSSGGGGCQY